MKTLQAFKQLARWRPVALLCLISMTFLVASEPAHSVQDSAFINRPQSLWRQHKRTVILTTLALAAQSILIAVFLMQIRRRSQAETSLRESEKRYRNLFTRMTEGYAHGRIVIENGEVADWIYLSINPAFEEMFGLKDAVGHSAAELVPNIREQAPEAFKVFARVTQGGEPERFENYVPNVDAWFSVNAFGFGPDEFVATFENITQRKRAEQALSSSQEILSKFVQNSPIYAFIKEVTPTESRVLIASENFIEMVGIPGHEMTGKTMADLFPEEFAAKITADDWAVASSGNTLTLDEALNGRSYTTIKFPIFSEGKVFLAGYTIDLTERIQAEAERAQLERHLAHTQKLESLGSLAGGVAHDMNNVLSAILSLASIHQMDSPEGTPLRASMDTITKACLRGRTLVQGLLGFARKDLVTEKILDLNGLIREEIALLERTTLQKVTLKIELAEDLWPIKGDPGALSHALMNLCVNAVDAMPTGGTLRLRTHNEAPSQVLLEVIDTGCGMPKEVLDKALDPFFTTKPQGKGTGLGLPLVYGTVKAHHGQMEIQSAPGNGTTVRIYLPASPATLEPAQIEKASPISEMSLRPARVDDDSV